MELFHSAEWQDNRGLTRRNLDNISLSVSLPLHSAGRCALRQEVKLSENDSALTNERRPLTLRETLLALPPPLRWTPCFRVSLLHLQSEGNEPSWHGLCHGPNWMSTQNKAVALMLVNQTAAEPNTQVSGAEVLLFLPGGWAAFSLRWSKEWLPFLAWRTSRTSWSGYSWWVLLAALSKFSKWAAFSLITCLSDLCNKKKCLNHSQK